MKTLFRLLPIVLLIFLGTAFSRAADDLSSVSPLGLWKNDDARFEIFESGGKLGAKIVGLTEPNTKEGKPKTDFNNPDPAQRKNPIIGLVFMKNFSPAGNGRWEKGTIYDPKNGKTYASYMQLENRDTIRVRGYIGFSALGRTQVWTRAK